MTHDKNAPVPADAPTDDLLARYHAAQTALDAPEASGPTAQARANILDYAAKVATDSVAARAINVRTGGPLDSQKPSANDSQWKIRALATVAIFGLTSLLLLQWDRGTPEEKEVAFSTARPPAAAPAPVAEPAPAAAPAATPPVPAATTMAEAPAAATPADKSDASAKAAPPSAKLAAPKVAPQPPRASASPQPFPAEADAKRPSGVRPPLPDAATTAESAMTGATALPMPAPPAVAALPAPASGPPSAPSVAAAAPPAPAAMRAAPTAKAQSYGATQSARRDDAPQATGDMKKSDSADDKSTTADSSAAPASRAASPNLALFAAIRSADTAAVQQALASGADKNAKSNGTPAITLCVQSGKLNLVQLLAGAGADVNAPDAQGITPLAHARARGFDAIASTLLSLGAN
jgi:hypothetical protein